VSARITEMPPFVALLRDVVPEIARGLKKDTIPPDVLAHCLYLHRDMLQNGEARLSIANFTGELEVTMKGLCVALAILSLQPGGVDAFGLHFENGEVTES